jgi:hypothetical protein
MLYGNCAWDMQSYSRQGELWSAAAALPHLQRARRAKV